MFERFDDQARLTVERAFDEARAFRHDQVGTEHLLLGLLSGGQGHAAEALISCGATLEGCRAKVVEAAATKRRPPPGPELTLTDRASRALERATRLSLRQRSRYVDTDHILLSVLDVEGTAGQVLRGLFVDLARLRAAVSSGDKTETAVDTVETSGPPKGGIAPRCPRCDRDLDSTLAQKTVPSHGPHGTTGRWLIAYCSSCGTALGGHLLAD